MMKTKTILIIIWALVWSSLPLGMPPGLPLNALAAESDLTLEQILDRMEKHYAGSSFTANFVQESTVRAMEITDFASGKIFVRHPGKMRWEYEKPEQQVIITDGFTLWIYRPADNQVMTGKAPAFFSDGKGASFLSDITLVRKKFSISMVESKDDFFYELNLKPLEKTLDVTDIRLSVTKKTFTVIRVVTYNSYGDKNHIEFLNHQFNADLKEELFTFEAPEGTDVLQMDE
ncbi:MAG: outer membrane lipoprotein carrier protein LolA [Deltaproteobacteria bacterium]|nr:outer membrane lipoprotein carrier protein LolA [Deltaproteobacteria bacterium]